MKSNNSFATLIFFVILGMGGGAAFVAYHFNARTGSVCIAIIAVAIAIIVSIAVKVSEHMWMWRDLPARLQHLFVGSVPFRS